MEFSRYDARNYPMVDVKTGYGEWADRYENAMLDEMDVRLLERLAIDWSALATVADLACGTGRIGAWLAARGAGDIDGVDLTPAMLAQARNKGCYRRVVEADVRDTGLDAGSYDLVIQSLACEHLPELAPLYAEAARLARPSGTLVIAGYHPCFMLRGIPTHFDRRSGEPLAIDTHLHLLSDHVRAAGTAGWSLADMHERVVDGVFTAHKPSWDRHLGWPISYATAWQRQ
jgi:SAM-dependent methyltransferase